MSAAHCIGEWNTEADFQRFLLGVCPTLTDVILKSLFKSYGEEWRTYHNLKHIHDMFKASEVFRGKLSIVQMKALILMILFHDAVYKIGQLPGWNEYESASLAAKSLDEAHVSNYLKDFVVTGIIATATHTLFRVPHPFQQTVCALIDLDLMSLGGTAAEFDVINERVWGEFKAHHTRYEFNVGRSQWADRFLKRKRIFYTKSFAQLEQTARGNLERLTRIKLPN